MVWKKENHTNINKLVKAVIINFNDGKGDIVVENDNFGTRRKYADFTNGKRKAGLHPFQIVFSGIETACICKDRYIDRNGETKVFDAKDFAVSLDDIFFHCGKAKNPQEDIAWEECPE